MDNMYKSLEGLATKGFNYMANSFKRTFTLASIVGMFYAGCNCNDDDFVPQPESDNEITNVQVRAAPMDLAAIVTFETSDPSYPSVKFCLDDDCWSTIPNDDSLEEEHEVLVLGMGPDADYSLTAVAENENGETVSSDGHSFHTGSLPYELDLDFNWDVFDSDRADLNWTLASICWGSYNTPVIPVIFNEEGLPIAYYAPWSDEEGTADYQATWYDDKISIGGSIPQGERPVMLELSGNIAWEGAFKQPLDLYDTGWMHHAFHPTENGNMIMIAMSDSEVDVIAEFDPDLAKKSSDDDNWSLEDIASVSDWFWDASDYFTAEELGTFGNAAYVAGDEVGYYSRAYSMLNSIDRDSKEVVWQFGQLEREQNPIYGDFEEPVSGFPIEAHGAKKTPDGMFLFFDNGYLADDEENHHVRIVKYDLDVGSLTAENVFEYPGDNQDEWWRSGIGGDAVVLDNGNYLISSGLDLEPYPHRIFELTNDGEIIWELNIYGGHDRGVYTAEKIPPQAYKLE